jgi:plasmid stabilization system protein ParE
MKVIVRPQFYLDIEEEVYWLLANAGKEVSQRWHDAVWHTIELLQAHPQLGRERNDLKQPGIRSWRVKYFTRWLIFYALREESLVLYRVRSGLMNLTRLEMQT